MSGPEEAAYELLVERPGSTLPELTTWWDNGDLASVLDSLERKGLATRSDDPPRFDAVAPDVAFEWLLMAAEKRLDEARDETRRLIELHREHVLGADRNVVELVSGGDALHQRLAQMLRTAREQLRCVHGPGGSRRRDTTDAELELLARGGTCRTLYDRTAVEWPGTLATIERTAAAGGLSRVLPSVALELYLADDRIALLLLQSEPSFETALVVHRSGLLDALGDLFEGLWRRALPLGLTAGSTEPADPRLPDPARQRIIALLLSGITDQAIARQLGVSYRTAQRRIATLMDELDASTRFQAGVQAALRTHGHADVAVGDVAARPTRQPTT